MFISIRAYVKIAVLALSVLALSRCSSQASLPDVRHVLVSEDDEYRSIVAVLRSSQDAELRMYTRPEEPAEDLQRYWLPAAPGAPLAFDSAIIRRGIRRLAAEGLHYAEAATDISGSGTGILGARNEIFEIQSVVLFGDRKAAEIVTSEKWYLPFHDRSHHDVTQGNPNKGPYPVTYNMLKVADVWYVLNSNTPRRGLPMSPWAAYALPISVAAIVLVAMFVMWRKTRGRDPQA